MSNYMELNGKIVDVEPLGSPKTVRLEGTYNGEHFSAPMEVWIMALVSTLSPEQKAVLFTNIKNVESTGQYQKIQRARVVADIPMPKLI